MQKKYTSLICICSCKNLSHTAITCSLLILNSVEWWTLNCKNSSCKLTLVLIFKYIHNWSQQELHVYMCTIEFPVMQYYSKIRYLNVSCHDVLQACSSQKSSSDSQLRQLKCYNIAFHYVTTFTLVHISDFSYGCRMSCLVIFASISTNC